MHRGSQTLNGSGTATCETSFTTAGPRTIVATYDGTPNYLNSSSADLGQGVDAAGTTTLVSSSANPSKTGQTVTYTASVLAQSPGSGTPSGAVTFKNGGTVITCTGGSQTLNGSGTATCQTSFNTAGTKTIVATYGGTANYLTSSSADLSQVVNAADTTTSVSSPANPSKTGQTVTYTATVAAVSPGSGTPTGSVAFKNNGTTITGCGAQALVVGPRRVR